MQMQGLIRRPLALIVATSMVTLVASSALAQRPQGRGFGGGRALGPGLLMLAGQKSVQEDLKATDEQTKQISELAEKQRETLGGLRELDPDERRKKLEEQDASATAAL